MLPASTAPTLILISLAQKVQKRLVAILLHLVEHFPRSFDRKAPLVWPPAPPLSWYLLRTQHQPVLFDHSVSRLACRQSCVGDSNGSAVKAWLMTPCLGQEITLVSPGEFRPDYLAGRIRRDCEVWVAGRRLHHSHALAVLRGLYFCLECGCIAGHRAAHLVDPCQPATVQGRRNLSRLAEGRLPHSAPCWPAQQNLSKQSRLVLGGTPQNFTPACSRVQAVARRVRQRLGFPTGRPA